MYCRRNRQLRIKKEREEKGICNICGKHKTYKGRKRCHICRRKRSITLRRLRRERFK